MPKTLYLIRHAQTDHNLNGIAQGHIDLPLNPTGLNQANALVHHFDSIKFDAIFSSDQARSIQTAQPIAQSKNLTLIKSNLIKERDLGIIQGQKWQHLQENSLHLLRNLNNIHLPHWNEHHGETLHQLDSRVKDFFKYLQTNHKGQQLAIVLHGGSFRSFLRLLGFKKHAQNIHLANASITTIQKNILGKYTIKDYNNTQHL